MPYQNNVTCHAKPYKTFSFVLVRNVERFKKKSQSSSVQIKILFPQVLLEITKRGNRFAHLRIDSARNSNGKLRGKHRGLKFIHSNYSCLNNTQWYNCKLVLENNSFLFQWLIDI